MLQLTMDGGLALQNRRPALTRGPVYELLSLLEQEGTLVFVAVFRHGNMLKCIAQLLQRCAPCTSFAVCSDGLLFIAFDPGTSRLIHVDIRPADLVQFRYQRAEGCRYALETSSLYADRAWT